MAKQKPRRVRADFIRVKIQAAVEDLEELQEEIDNWSGGMEGTNLEATQKYEDLGTCRDAIEEIVSDLNQAEMSIEEIEWPGWN